VGTAKGGDFRGEGAGRGVHDARVGVGEGLDGGEHGALCAAQGQGGGDAAAQRRGHLGHRLAHRPGPAGAQAAGRLGRGLQFRAALPHQFNQARQRFLGPQLPQRLDRSRPQPRVGVVEDGEQGLDEVALLRRADRAGDADGCPAQLGVVGRADQLHQLLQRTIGHALPCK
jgi:hypothetical protein